MSAVAAGPTRRGRRVPTLVSVHGVPDADYRAAARVLRWSGVPAVACGPGVARELAAAGVSVATIIVNGIAPPPSGQTDRRLVLDQWGLAGDAPFVLAVGRLVPQKNHAVAVQAVARLPSANLVVLGSGPLRDELLELARGLGVAHRVVLPGDRPDARSIMASADVVVLPSRWEGLPLVGLEALAARTPLVASNAVGIRELFEDGTHCLLVDPEDPASLAEALSRVIGDDSLRTHLVEAGAALVSNYTEEAMVNGFSDFYAKLIHAGR